MPAGRNMRGGEIPRTFADSVAILSRFCLEPENPSNSAAFSPLRAHAYSITHINDDNTVPKVTQPNWLSYNNFRSGDLSAPDGLAAPDLVLVTPESCISLCSAPDELELWVQLGNLGAAPLTAGAAIEVYGTKMGVETLQDTIPFAGILAPGEYADAVNIKVDTKDLDQLRVRAVAKEEECKDDPANEVIIVPPFCMAPG